MRILAGIFLIVLLLTPLWAQEKDINNRTVEVTLQYDGSTLTSSFFDEVFQVELDYDPSVRFTKRITMSWPAFSSSDNYDYPWRLILDFRPPMWDDPQNKSLKHKPDQPDEYYAGIQYLSEAMDARIMYPFPQNLDGRHMTGFFELTRLRLLSLGQKNSIIAKGYSNFDFSRTDFDVGFSRQCGSFEAKIYSNLEWSIEFKTDISSTLR